MEPYEWEIWKYKEDKNDLNTAIAGILALFYFLLFIAVVLGYVKLRDKQFQETNKERSELWQKQ